MNELAKKPYEISIWEDRLVTEGDVSYYKEIKLAVIGSDRMNTPNRAYSPVLTENVNGEKTLTFSMAFKFYDEERGELVENPFIKFLINERKIKLFYNDEWFEFLIKERNESSDTYVFEYTARELFSLELSKVGYNITLDQSLNNNQGTIIELGEKVLEGTDWQVDKDNSDLLRQYVQEPIYKCIVTNKFSALNLDTNKITDSPIAVGEVIYVFYNYIKNKIVDNVQFIREADRKHFLIDDNNVIRSTNYRFIGPINYDVDSAGAVTGITNVATVDSVYFLNQGYKLVYGQLTTYDPIMNRTVDVYQAAYDDGKQDIYHYLDYTYTTSNMVIPYITNGSNFNTYDDGSLQGWSNKTAVASIEDKRISQPISLITRPEISETSKLSLIENFGNIEGFLRLKFSGTLNSEYENTYYNSGFNDNASIIDHITAGETFALRLRYLVGNTEHTEELSVDNPSKINGGIRAIVAKYEEVDQETYLSEDATTASKIKVKRPVPNEIVLDFNNSFSENKNIISNGIFNESFTQYLVDNVIQTPSTSYYYKTANNENLYVWDGKLQKYVIPGADYANYYITTAKARMSYSNETMHDPTFKLGVFLYIKDSELVDKYIFLQDIQLTRYYEDANNEPIVVGNVPAAASIQQDYFYLKPTDGTLKDEITTYGSLEFLAAELGINQVDIKPVYNENCEKISSIQASASNCFNILQDLCEAFECWLHIEVEHESDGRIKLDKDFNPIKKIAFKEYAGKENFSGFRNGINLSSIDRTINSDEIVTKLIVDPVQSDFSDTGSIDIQSAPSNPSGESSILNFSYYLNRGLITNVQGCNEDLSKYYEKLNSKNKEITKLNLENSNAQNALVRLESQRTVYTSLIEEATDNYNEAIQQFHDLTGMDYDEYVTKYHNVSEWASDQESEETKKEKDLVNNDTVVDIIGTIYMSTVTINNYSGVLTNLNKEYTDLDLSCNGARSHNISVNSIPNSEGMEPTDFTVQVTFEDYFSGIEFKLYTDNDSYVVYKTSPNDRVFVITSADRYTSIAFTNIPENYNLQYFIDNKKTVLKHDEAIGQKFSIANTDFNEVFNRHFILVPDEEYAKKYSGYQGQIDALIEEKSEIQKAFYKKYSRFIQEGTWSSQDYIDSELYYLDALQVSSTSSQPKVSYTINVLEVSQLDNLENYDFAIGDKTFIEDTDFFGYLIQLINYEDDKTTPVYTPVQEEVIISEIEWHLDEPENNTITIQNYKTRFEDLFQRISATVQTVQRNENTYPKTTSILDPDGFIQASLLAESINNLSSSSSNGFALSSNGSVATTDDGLIIRDLTNPANVMRLMSKGLQVSTDGGQSWNTAIDASGISTDVLNAGTINTQKIWLMDGKNPSFRWDKAGLNAYGLDQYGNQEYDLKTYVRFDKYGLYGIKNDENYVASSLDDVRNKAFFGVTWDGFFIKNSYTDDGEVSITSDDDIVVRKGNVKRIHIGAVEKDDSGAPTEYGIKIRNDNNEVVFETGDDGNLKVTGTINALSGNFSGQVSVGNPLKNHIIIDGREDNPTIRTSNYSDGAGSGWIINGNGDATFSNVSVRGAIKTAVFEYEEIQAVGGAFLFRPSSTIKSARLEVEPESPSEQDIEDYDGSDNPGTVPTGDLILTVEQPLMFRVGNWCKVSNYNSGKTNPEDMLTGLGLTHIYKVKEIRAPESGPDMGEDEEVVVADGPTDYEIVLENGAAITEITSLADLAGGALIDFGNHRQKDGIDVPGTQNYGIGINSSDNYVNLPARAISLFETTIHPTETTKVTYNYRGILGTLPQLPTTDVNDGIYNSNMAGTQGIYTNNMYIGDKKNFITYYYDKTANEYRLIINADTIYEGYDDEGQPIPVGGDGKDGEDAITVIIDSSTGNMFVRQDVRATLTCHVYQGSGMDPEHEITDQVTKFTWVKYDKNGIKDETWARLPGGQSITIGPEDVASKAIFKCEVEF